MIYTEYFARGTQPTAYCDLHPTRGILGKIAGLFGGDDGPPPPRIEDTGLRPAPAATNGSATVPAAAKIGTTAVTPAVDEEPRKKRGFWARLFGVGKDKEKDEKSGQNPTPSKKTPGQ